MKTFLVVAALAAGVLVPASTSTSAQAADPPTCRGLPATLVVGQQSGVVRGTSGDDVVVIQDGGAVLAGAGDDTVCAVGTGGRVTVDGGAGDDVIDLSGWVGTGPVNAYAYAAEVFTGDGRDEVVGSAGGDFVQLLGSGPDQVSVGDGADRVDVAASGLDDGTRVALGDGDDEFWVRQQITAGALDPAAPDPATAAPVGGSDLGLDGGAGRNSLRLWANTSFHVDAGRGRVRSHEGDIRYRGVDQYEITGRSAQRSSFRGSARAESLRAIIRNVGQIDMSGGDDRVELLGRVRPVDGARVVTGGGGRNTLAVSARGFSQVDLGRGRFTSRGRLQARLTGFRAAQTAGVERLVGSRNSDTLTWSVCDRVTVLGGGGNDVVRPAVDTSAGVCDRPAVLRGGAGDDRITGGPGDDRIDGGAGRDRADGGAGRNVCRSVERARHCRS